MSQADMVFEYFKARPGEDVAHSDVVDWAVRRWHEKTGKVLRDPDRQIRSLYDKGLLVKVGKGVYRYDPNAIAPRNPEDFSLTQKAEIMRRDEHRCVICGRGEKDGVELQVDHIRPRARGGKATVENGQTLCAQHNFQKKAYEQTETGKRFIIRLYELAEKENDARIRDFCRSILQVYEEHGVNGHIEWKR